MADPIKDPGKEPEKTPAGGGAEVLPDPEPRPRRSAESFIIQRKDKEIEELKKEKEHDGGDDIDQVTPEGKKAIDQAVEEVVAPLRESIGQQADNQELQQVLESHKDDEIKVPESILSKYVQHPAYKNVSIDFIYSGLQNEYQRRANEKKKAEDEAEEGNLPGTSRRPASQGKLPDFSAMTDAEFEAWDRENNRGE